MINDKKKPGFSLRDGLTVKVENPGLYLCQVTFSPPGTAA
jgi:hypothetical protein